MREMSNQFFFSKSWCKSNTVKNHSLGVPSSGAKNCIGAATSINSSVNALSEEHLVFFLLGTEYCRYSLQNPKAL